jgi:serine phosphatase RsbU (regulator of sigma subunit)
VRLEALNPPLGIAEFDAYSERALDWAPGTDSLVLFTDGLSECLRSDRIWSDDAITEIVSEAGGSSAGSILDLLFDLACAPGGVAVDDRTAVVVR